MTFNGGMDIFIARFQPHNVVPRRENVSMTKTPKRDTLNSQPDLDACAQSSEREIEPMKGKPKQENELEKLAGARDLTFERNQAYSRITLHIFVGWWFY